MAEDRDISQFEVLFGKKLLRKVSGAKACGIETVNVDDLNLGANERIGIYFSAHWCPPCRGFTPTLIKTYNAINAGGKKFEVVFVSSDGNQQAFDDYYKDMPWLAVPFEDRGKQVALSHDYGISGIPALVLLDSDGVLLTKDGRSKVANGVPFPWACSPGARRK